MTETDTLGRAALTGAIAGLIGGLVFGFAMNQIGVPKSMAVLLWAGSVEAAYVLHMLVAAVAGAGLGVVAQWQRTGPGETVFLGLAYGTLWWFLLPLTVQPLVLLTGPEWDMATLTEQFPGLVGHLLYGVSTGLALVAIRERGAGEGDGPGLLSVASRGVLSGLAAAWLLQAVDDRPAQLELLSVPGLDGPAGTLVLGATAGLGYALLYPRSTPSAGAALIRGQAYGFVVWLVGPLTLFPLVRGGRLTWTVTQAWDAFAVLVGLLLLGAATALVYQWLGALARTFISSDTRMFDRTDTDRWRALGRDVAAGSVGGLLFTLVMAQSGFLSSVARLVGSSALLVGFLVHLGISVGIGVSYGLLFRRQSYSLATGLGWGVSYGFFWWLLGPLTVLPMMLGAGPQWTAEAAAGAFASLVGHLAYGAGLGAVFHLVEQRLNPGWQLRSINESARSRQLHQQVLASGPALWSVMIVIILTVPVILGSPG